MSILQNSKGLITVLYNNIGKKIKWLAKLIFIAESVISVIAGLCLIIFGYDMVLLALTVLLICPLLAFVSSWLLYGFGEIIEKLTSLERNMCGSNSNYEEPKSYEYYKRVNEVDRLYSQGLINEQEYRRVIDGIK